MPNALTCIAFKPRSATRRRALLLSGELSPPSALTEELLSAVAKTSAEFWPGVPVVPIMSAGASDGRFLRNVGIPTFGHSGLAGDQDDVRARPRQG